MSLPDAQHGLDWPERKRILLEFIAAEDQRQLEAEQRKLAEGLAKNLRQMLTPAQVVEEHVPGISPALAIDATPECPSDPNDSAPSSSSSNHQASVSSGLSSVTSQMDDKDDDYIADFLMEDSATFGSEWEYERMTDSNSADTDISDEGSSSAIGDSQDNYGLIFNDLGLELQPELPRYQEEPLLQKEQQQLRQDLEVPIKCHGREQLLQQHLNLDLLGPQGLARCVESPGSWAVCSPEQSDKTVGLAGIGLVSYRKRKPSVAMVCDLKNNAKKVQESLQALLRPYGIEVRYMSGERPWQDASQSIIFLDAFREERIMLVMSNHKAEIMNLNIFLSTHNISGLTLSIDESNNVWTSYIEDASSTSELL